MTSKVVLHLKNSSLLNLYFEIYKDDIARIIKKKYVKIIIINRFDTIVHVSYQKFIKFHYRIISLLDLLMPPSVAFKIISSSKDKYEVTEILSTTKK